MLLHLRFEIEKGAYTSMPFLLAGHLHPVLLLASVLMGVARAVPDQFAYSFRYENARPFLHPWFWVLLQQGAGPCVVVSLFPSWDGVAATIGTAVAGAITEFNCITYV